MEQKERTKGIFQKKEVFGAIRDREEVMERIKKDGMVYEEFLGLSDTLQNEMVEFCMGVRGIKMTYDPFFKYIFDPSVSPERLEDLIGSCLGQKVEIVEVIPNESQRIMEEGSLLVVDMLVRLETGALVNVEIQRFGYMFPGARCACYSSDLMMRQYSQVRARMRKEKKRFSYKDIKKVYTIVLMQKSTMEFHRFPGAYIHSSRQVFDTGLEFDMLQEYVLIPLDIFLKNQHNNLSRLDAWLYFIASDSPEDIRRVIAAYPEFEEMYREIFRFRYEIKELVGMFSEALRILDANTTQYMIEEQQKEIEKNQKTIEKNQKTIEENRKTIEENQRTIEENQRTIEENRRTIDENRKMITGKEKEIEEKQKTITEQAKEIERLRALLAQKNS